MAWLVAIVLLVACIVAANYKKERVGIAPVKETRKVKKELVAVLVIACVIAFLCAIDSSSSSQGSKTKSSSGSASPTQKK
jgi:hypothetical protein